MNGLFMNVLSFCVLVRRVLLPAFVLGWVLSALPVQAAAASGSVAALERISDSMEDKVVSVLRQQQKGLGCSDLKIVKKESISVFSEPANPELGIGARWVIRYLVDSCLGAGYRSAVFDGRRGSVEVEALVPGETLADPDLQRDILKSYRLAATRIMPQCPEPLRMRATTLVARPAKPDSPWIELWIGNACGRDIGQRIEFRPNKAGTRFALTLPKAAPSQPAAPQPAATGQR